MRCDAELDSGNGSVSSGGKMCYFVKDSIFPTCSVLTPKPGGTGVVLSGMEFTDFMPEMPLTFPS